MTKLIKPHPLLPILPILLFLLSTQASAHGLTSWPRQRGLLAANDFSLKPLAPSSAPDYCPHCLNGGGVGVVSSHIPDKLWTPYEPTDPTFPFRDDHSLCGDPKHQPLHMAPDGLYFANVTIATYEQADFVDMEVHINAHHNGYFEFFICNLDACASDDISKQCFQQGFCEKLIRVPHKSCESGHDRICGPVHPDYPGRWYLPPRDEKHPTDNWYGGLNKKMRYALPHQMLCERCVIHWAWTTANGCNPPGYAEYNFPQKWDGLPGDGGSVGGINRQFGTCGESPTHFPEEFWSCSENVRIVKKNRGKSRSLQVFRDGDMNIEGPDDSNSEQLMEPLPEPVSTPSPVKPPAQPQPVHEMGAHTDSGPQQETSAKASTEPPVETAQPAAVMESLESTTDSGAYPTETVQGGQNGSKYDLYAYLSTFDTGTCTKAKNGQSFCEACVDLGYGVTKCMWCRNHGTGKETCMHEKPKH